MRAYKTIVVTQVRSLEVGDMIATSFLDGVISGKVTGVPYSKYDLTLDQLDYMVEHKLTIPEGEFVAIGSPGERLIFGEFVGTGRFANHASHMYVREDDSVAVFPTDK